MGKKQRALLRKLSGEAYRRELDGEIERLESRFKAWRKGEMSCFELSECIHEFHDGASRSLWKQYNQFKPDGSVASALARGVLKESEVPAALREGMQNRIDFFRGRSEGKAEDG